MGKTFLMVKKPSMDEQYLHIYLPKELYSHSKIILLSIYIDIANASSSERGIYR